MDIHRNFPVSCSNKLGCKKVPHIYSSRYKIDKETMSSPSITILVNLLGIAARYPRVHLSIVEIIRCGLHLEG